MKGGKTSENQCVISPNEKKRKIGEVRAPEEVSWKIGGNLNVGYLKLELESHLWEMLRPRV